MNSFQRVDRIADLIQRELARIIQFEMNDPRLSLVTITAVKVSKDLSYAKVFITQHVEEKKINDTLRVLANAAGHLRYCLAKEIKTLRIIPELRFVYDASIAQGARLSALIDEAIAKDEDNKSKS